MKVAHIHIDCCRECPYAERVPKMRFMLCTMQKDGTDVSPDDIDEGCPLDDETLEQE